MSGFLANFNDNWPYWLVSVVLVYAAYIDGKQLRVPNWITFPMIISGWIYSCIWYAVDGQAWYVGLGWSLAGTAVGLATLLPAYAIGGMGAGDVKLMAGIGAWVYCAVKFYAFCVSAIVGAILAVAMIIISRQSKTHWNQFFFIINEIMTVRNPEALATIAGERKSSMRLLPYGIPIAIGTIMYFAWMGMLI
jgi:prepilin peptidase CpaA